MISVIVLSKNNDDTLDKCLKSIIKSEGEKEIIVVDAHSTDNTPQILRKYRGKIKVVYDEGKGIGIARNIGVKHSKGDIICFVDADACVSKDHFTKIKKFFNEHPEVGVLHVTYAVRATANSSIVERMEDFLRHSEEVESSKTVSSEITLAAGCFMSFRREVFDEVGGFWKFPPYGADDLDFSMKALIKGWRVGIIETNSWHSPRTKLLELFKEMWGWGKGKACWVKKWRNHPLTIKIFENRRSFKFFGKNVLAYSIVACLASPLVTGLRCVSRNKSLMFYVVFVLRQYVYLLGFIYGWFTWARRF